MNEALYTAMRQYIDVAVELKVEKRMQELRSQPVETRAVEGPPGKDGRDGIDGKDGKDGERGPPGEKGERGADGLHGRDGAPGPQGERGADGIASRAELESLIEQRFAELQVRTFADLYQGVFDEKKHYTRGQLATCGGSLWLSQTETRAKPGEGNSDWKLIVKRGTDAKR